MTGRQTGYAWLAAALAAVLSVVLIIGLYLPGLHGSWLVDDTPNIEVFLGFTPDNAPYHELIFSNNSGPLGRPVSMASFALNHAAGLFSPYALKATNLFIHLCNAIALFFLLQGILAEKAATRGHSPRVLAGVLTLWWALLPLHVSSVLYIVQRMALLGSLFSLLCLLSYMAGRRSLRAHQPLRGGLLLATSLLLLFPLALLAKESAFSVLPWLVLLELFLFQPRLQKQLPRILLGLVLVTVVAAAVLVPLLSLHDAYMWRDFSLAERLLSEARVVCSYVHHTFLPDSSNMGVFHDDYAVSSGLFTPWTTAPALLAIAAMVLAGIALAATSWSLLALGLLFFLSGHLLESTVIPLELYFEHRNYLPAAGLLLAASQLLLRLPVSTRALATGLTLYLAIVAFSTYQRSETWGDQTVLLAVSADNHPQSVRAWTDYAENLVSRHDGLQALQIANKAAQANPELSSIFYLQMITIYCRSDQTPPPELIQVAAERLGQLPVNKPSTFISISTGLDFILTQQREKHCGTPDFSPLASGILQFDQALASHFGAQRSHPWALRMIMGEWLLELHRSRDAVQLLQDVWDHGDKTEQPLVGLTLAKALQQAGETARLQQVLDELERVADNPPPDFKAEMASLRSGQKE